MYFTVCPLCGPGSISGRGAVFQGIIPWLITLCQPVLTEPAWQKIAQSPLNGTTQPVDIEEEGQSPTMNKQRLNKNHSIKSNF